MAAAIPIGSAEFYGGLKARWNCESPYFGSAKPAVHGTPYTIIWDASTGNYWWRESAGGYTSHIGTSVNPIGLVGGWTLQLGGASFNYMLVAGVPAGTKEKEVWLNAYRFLYLVGYVPRTDETVKHNAMGMCVPPANISVKWLDFGTASEWTPEMVHAVWFRKPGSRLTAEICERFASWPAMNPAASFHLWTDIPPADLADWLTDVSGGAWELLRGRVQIHCAEETADLVGKCLDMFDAGPGLRGQFVGESAATPQSLVFKTDFLRVFILALYGGIYVDFNDCICVDPLADLFKIYSPHEPFGVSDACDLEHANNFFLYCPAGGHPTWTAAVKSMVGAVEPIISIIEDPTMKIAIRSCLLGTMAIDEVDAHYKSRHPLTEKIPWRLVMRSIAQRLTGRRLLKREDFAPCPQAADASMFDPIYADEWMDANFRILMHATNITIHCRQVKIPLALVAWGYYRPYNCAMSWVAHIGDGSSYGRPERGKYSIREM